jgi:hypothetical protein
MFYVRNLISPFPSFSPIIHLCIPYRTAQQIKTYMFILFFLVLNQYKYMCFLLVYSKFEPSFDTISNLVITV